MAENRAIQAEGNEKAAAGSIFREKSLQRVSSPEELNDYIRVTTPSVWVVLAALVLLLAGMLAYSVFGTVETHASDGSTKDVHPIVYVMN